MKILVACEYSGIVRDAFETAGWDAWSCDLLPTESEQTIAAGKHIQGDVLQHLSEHAKEYDLMIAHPPCTYLSFAYTGSERYSVNRLQEKIKAYQLEQWTKTVLNN